ncbi:MAG: hypothetical protein IJ235_03500 [Eubacterium sp.]|nr:hypothetical protein [Eubacterium sp.]
MTRAKTNTISSGQLACLLVISRLASAMMNESVSLVQFACELAVTVLFSLLVLLTERFNFRVNKIFLAAAFFALAAADCVSYISFTKIVAHPEVPVAVISVLIAAFSLYAGLLGSEAVARFSALALLFAAACVLVAVITNIPAMRVEFLKYNKAEKIDVLSLVKCLDVPVIYALFSPHTASKKGRALLLGTAIPYAVSAGAIISCRALLGKTAYIYSSPIFALFQLAKQARLQNSTLCIYARCLSCCFAKFRLQSAHLNCLKER